MESKKLNAEGKTSACQKKKTSFISAMFDEIFTKKIYISNVIILKSEIILSVTAFQSLGGSDKKFRPK